MTMPGGGNLFSTLLRIRRAGGLLGYLEQQWAIHGDLFALELGLFNAVVVIHPDMVRQITVTRRERYSKTSSYEVVRRYLLGNGLVTSVGDNWKRQRRTVAPFFTPRAVGEFAEMMLNVVDEAIEPWAAIATEGSTIDATDETVRVAGDIMLKAIFSESNDTLTTRVQGDVETMLDFSSSRQSVLIRTPLWWPGRATRRYVAARDRVRAYVRELIARRRATPADTWPSDLLSQLIETTDDEPQAFDEGYLFDQAMTFFVAGYETTARTMGLLLYSISRHPEVEARLTAEIDRVTEGEPVTTDHLRVLTYATQVIKESLRLYGATAYYPRDVVEDDVLGGYPVRAGQTIMLAPYLTHRHPDFWDAPETFDPDRFCPEREKAMHPQQWAPFSAGERVCVGNNFAMMEMLVLLAKIYSAYRPRLVSGHDPKIAAPSLIAATNGLPMTVQSRADARRTVTRA